MPNHRLAPTPVVHNLGRQRAIIRESASAKQSRQFLQAILVTQPTEDPRGFDPVACRNLVTLERRRRWRLDGRRDA